MTRCTARPAPFLDRSRVASFWWRRFRPNRRCTALIAPFSDCPAVQKFCGGRFPSRFGVYSSGGDISGLPAVAADERVPFFDSGRLQRTLARYFRADQALTRRAVAIVDLRRPQPACGRPFSIFSVHTARLIRHSESPGVARNSRRSFRTSCSRFAAAGSPTVSTGSLTGPRDC